MRDRSALIEQQVRPSILPRTNQVVTPRGDGGCRIRENDGNVCGLTVPGAANACRVLGFPGKTFRTCKKTASRSLRAARTAIGQYAHIDALNPVADFRAFGAASCGETGVRRQTPIETRPVLLYNRNRSLRPPSSRIRRSRYPDVEGRFGCRHDCDARWPVLCWVGKSDRVCAATVWRNQIFVRLGFESRRIRIERCFRARHQFRYSHRGRGAVCCRWPRPAGARKLVGSRRDAE